MAGRQVSSIPELLEKILLELPEADLLVNARRVCKTWSPIIVETSSIRRKLFLMPSAPAISPEPAHKGYWSFPDRLSYQTSFRIDPMWPAENDTGADESTEPSPLMHGSEIAI
jgi:hypothetical protein